MITCGSPIFGNHPNVVNHKFEPFRHLGMGMGHGPNKNLPGDQRNLWPGPVGPGAVWDLGRDHGAHQGLGDDLMADLTMVSLYIYLFIYLHIYIYMYIYVDYVGVSIHVGIRWFIIENLR